MCFMSSAPTLPPWVCLFRPAGWTGVFRPGELSVSANGLDWHIQTSARLDLDAFASVGTKKEK